ncbi:MAG: phosphate ABC transporter substrate-binding/OmpA family protein, partial [Acidobacteria bacterium]|nr:phosphate ABC transporter substrate-binding/OmpA family protein [Acidobacteriota bacterium]
MKTVRRLAARALLGGILLASLHSTFALGDEGTPVLHIKGSDTIGGELGPALAAAYGKQHPETRIEWESLGSGTAFVGLFDGSADLGASSRPVKESEVARAGELGIRLSEYVLGFDGIAVIVHPSNPVERLTIAELSKIFAGEVSRWSQVGGPDRPIHRISRPSYSGTHGFFKDVVLRRGDKNGSEEFAADTRMIEENHEIVELVSGDRDAISYVGLGWVSPEVRAVPVAAASASEAVVPQLATVRDGTYPIYRPLQIYSREEPVGLARDFLAYILSPAGQKLVAEHGFMPSGVPLGPASSSRRPTRAEGSRLQVHFPFGGARLSTEDQARLASFTDGLKGQGTQVLVIGHTDSAGSRATNFRVSMDRARSVARYLESRG